MIELHALLGAGRQKTINAKKRRGQNADNA